jgi:CubicO group peptidase (beta-lactamase class C family)
MTDLHETLSAHVEDGSVPGAVGLVARGDEVEVAVVGHADAGGTAPLARESIFRIASLTKPVTAAAVLMLVEDGRLALDAPVARWLPELAAPSVVRTPSSPLDDVVPATRPITVADLLTFRAGWGYPSDFSLPAVTPLFTDLRQGATPLHDTDADTWTATLARIPLLHQPGEAWLYNACSDIQGVLIARVSGTALPDFLAERIFVPLGMTDTGFAVPAADLHRFTHLYRPQPDGGLEHVDAPDGQWSTRPTFPSGAGGLVSTVDDLHAFARMLLAGGTTDDGRRILTAEAVRQMTTDHVTDAQRDAATLFLQGQGWGYGGSVDIRATDPWNVPGRYGWVGGTGTSSYLVPSTGAVAIMLTQVEMTGPTSTALLRDFWRYAAA